jgi:ABC-2 type transport system permease protein
VADPRAAGTIYDLGYEHYAGPRRGRWYAFRTLVAFSFRAAFGTGRGQRAQVIPFIVCILVIVPAAMQVAFAAAMGRGELINYAQHLEFCSFFLALFAASQAPELIVGDRESGTLSLYLSRSLHPTDYALAKLVALALALLALTLGPQLVMFSGKVLTSETPWQAFLDEYKKLAPIVGGTLLASCYMAAIGLSLAVTAARRAYASAIIIAFFVLMPAVATVAGEIAQGDTKRYMVLFNPFLLMTGFANWLFDVQSNSYTLQHANLPGRYYLYVMAATCVIGVAALLYRFRKAEE